MKPRSPRFAPFSLLVFLFLLLAGCKPSSPSSSAEAPPQISPLTLASPWWYVTAKVLVLDAPGPPFTSGHMVSVPAKFATYQFTTTQSGGSALTRLPVMVLPDPVTGTTTIISGSPIMFYVSAPAGLTAYTVGPTLDWNNRLFALPAADGSPDTAIARFQSGFSHAILESSAGPSPLLAHPLDLASAAPPSYFSEGPSPAKSLQYQIVDSVALSGGVLRLSVHNPATGIPATFWIDLPTQKIVEATVAGRQMNLATGQPSPSS